MLRLLQSITHLGVTKESDEDEARKTRILNIVFLIGTPVVIYYLIKNYTEELFPLAAMNMVLLARNLLFFYFNYKQKIYHARIVLSLVGTVTTALSAVWFHNGMENFLLLNMVLIALLLPKKWVNAILIPLNAVIFVFVSFYNDKHAVLYIVQHSR